MEPFNWFSAQMQRYNLLFFAVLRPKTGVTVPPGNESLYSETNFAEAVVAAAAVTFWWSVTQSFFPLSEHRPCRLHLHHRGGRTAAVPGGRASRRRLHAGGRRGCQRGPQVAEADLGARVSGPALLRRLQPAHLL